MTQKKFGSEETTGRKLDVIGEYVAMYQRALGNTSLRTLYIDGFAGTGEIPLAEAPSGMFGEDENAFEDVKTFIEGSVQRALDVKPPFNRYVFIDKRKSCINALKDKFAEHPNISRVDFRVGDANAQIQKLCADEQWRFQRGVVFLDPFGSQVDWATVKAIAATEALDLWYLFPAGLSVFRQIGSDGTVDPTHEPSLTRILGTEDWKTAFFKPSPQRSLFDDEPASNEKVVTPESAADFMIERLSGVFKGGVMDQKIPLGKHAYPSYYLLFALGNSSPSAKSLAHRLSKAAVNATDRKHGRTI